MFPKNMKSVLIITILFVMSLVSVVLYADCDMMALIAKEGYTISQFGDISGSYEYPYDFFQFLISRSTPNNKRNDDGYGVFYYPIDGSFFYNPDDLYDPDNQAWYKISQDLSGNWHYGYNGWTWYGDPNHYWLDDEPLDIARDLILNIGSQNCEATIVLGHDRQGTGGSGNHPFRLEYNDQMFTFMQNGGIEDGTTGNPDEPIIKEILLDELNNANWFDEDGHESNWEGDPNSVGTWIDSEIFFHWLMKNIDDQNGCIIEGIHKAITTTVFDGDTPVNLAEVFSDPYSTRYDWVNCINFVLSDGNNLYVFKNGEDSHHTLYLQTDLEGFYSVNTFISPANNTEIAQFDFVVISRDEEPVVYPNFLDIDVKTFSSGVTWTSCPRLTEQGTFSGEIFEQAYYENSERGLLQLTSGGNPTITDFDKILGNRNGNDIEIDYTYPNFIDVTGFDNMLFRHEGYKIVVTEGAAQTILIVDGERLGSYYLDMNNVEKYWLGYYIPYSQNIEYAFGDFWGDVSIVCAEDWYYDRMYMIRDGNATQLSANSTKGKTMEYGKMYIVYMHNDVTDFHWNGSGTAEEPTKRATPQNFGYTEKPDYEAIDVVNIPSNVTEIGVFEEDECVGAVVVEDSCAQILVYSDNANRDPVPFTFEVVTGRGISTPIKDYLVLNLMTGEFETNTIISGMQGYSAIKLGEQEESENIITKPILYGNYPNPFNPITTISFTLPKEENIEITIYNIKGQKVRILYSGIAEEGKNTMIWEGKDTNGKEFSSGIYFYKLETNNKELTRKMLLLK